MLLPTRLSAALTALLTLAAAAPVHGPAPVALQSRGSPPQSGIPFGLFGMPGRMLVDPYTSAMQQAQPKNILADLAAAKARGAHIVVNLAGGINTWLRAGLPVER